MNTESFNWMAEVLGERIFSASWQGGLLAGAVWLVCYWFKRLPPTARCWMWRLVMLKMLIALIWVRPFELEVLSPRDSRTATLIERSGKIQPVTQVPYEYSPPGTISAAAVELVAPPVKITSPPIIEKKDWNWRLAAGFAWVSGVLASLALMAAHFFRARKLKRGAVYCTESWLLEMAVPIARELGLVKPPRVAISETVSSPLLIGMLRPTVILPSAVTRETSSAEIQMILAHELAHVRRGDLGWTLVASVTRAIFFFHPMAWLTYRESVLAQELACDEIAVRLTGDQAIRYAEMILEVVTRMSQPLRGGGGGFALGVGDNKRSLERRIRSMKWIGQKPSRTTRWGTSIAVGALLIMLIPIRLIAEKPLPPGEEIEEKPPADRWSAIEQPYSDEWVAERSPYVDQWSVKTMAMSGADESDLLKSLEGKSRKELRQILPTVVRDRQLDQLLDQLARVEQEHAKLTIDFSDDHPEVKGVERIMETINRQIEERIDGVLAGLEVGGSKSEEVEIATVQEKVARLQREIDKARQLLQDNPNDPEFKAGYFEKKRKLEGAQRKLDAEIERLKGMPYRSRQDVDAYDPSAYLNLGRVPVYAVAGGMVQTVNFKKGDKVQANQILIELDQRAVEARLKTAAARLKLAEAEHGIASAEFSELKDDFERKSDLKSQKLISEDELPNLEKAKASFARSRALLELAQLEYEERHLERDGYFIRAPYDGVISSIVHRGYLVPLGGGKILAEIVVADSEERQIKW